MALTDPSEKREFVLSYQVNMLNLEIMKTHVVAVGNEASLAEAVDLMDLYQVNGLPVLDGNGNLCGMLTEADILREVFPPESHVALSADLSADSFRSLQNYVLPTVGAKLVRDCMTCPALFVLEHGNLEEAAVMLLARGLKRVPVITNEGQVVGVLNRCDVFQALFESDEGKL